MDVVSSFLPENIKNKFSRVESLEGFNIYRLDDKLFVHLQKSEDVNKWKESTRYLISDDSKRILFLGTGKYTEKKSNSSKLIVRDHVNVSGKNPLIGRNIPEFGPRFFDVNNMYDKGLIKKLKQNINNSLKEGNILIPKSMQNRTELETEILNISGTNIAGITQDIFAGALTASHAGVKSSAILYFDEDKYNSDLMCSLTSLK